MEHAAGTDSIPWTGGIGIIGLAGIFVIYLTLVLIKRIIFVITGTPLPGNSLAGSPVEKAGLFSICVF
jgi:hypothetical protein